MSSTTSMNSIPARAGPDTIFARIRPSNDDAINHFHEIVDSMRCGFLQHQGNFIRIDDYQTQLGKAPGHSQRWMNWSPAKNPELTRPVWTGEFILYLKPDPPIRRNKWRIGGVYDIDGHVQERGEAQSELLLWDKYESTEVHHEAELAFDRVSGILTIRGRCDSNPNCVILDSDDTSSSTRLLNEHSHKLQFGSCVYSFQYEFGEDSPHETYFQQDKVAFFARRFGIGPPIFWTSATPTISFPKIKNWVIHRNVSSGGSGVVRAASRSPPQCAAVKTMVRRDAFEAVMISQEIKTAVHIRALLKNKPCPYILRFIEEKYDRNQEKWDEKSPEQVHLIFTPLCNQTFYSLVKSSAAWPADRLSLLHNVIEGLKWLHSNDLVHRDIKLENLGVVFHPKVRAVILDFGVVHHGTKNIDPGYGPVGTLDYLAPEAESAFYDEKVDIWALGIVAFRMFISHDLPWMLGYHANPWKMETLPTEQITSDVALVALMQRSATFSNTMTMIGTGNEGDVRGLICQMLTWNAHERPSAQDCSIHQCFRPRPNDEE
ncbi:hypothetical protein PISL3812_00653 [Talaromyces islandicus]|uniref:Protein kinase domain-containing protein n=1 Tax=Talaromyces islandicus TaxID=28573 RepID=A0A0U1LKK2_TALIS|nr:hypothetical protein PISL3812_00653 [Talaromyces islandicus]